MSSTRQQVVSSLTHLLAGFNAAFEKPIGERIKAEKKIIAISDQINARQLNATLTKSISELPALKKQWEKAVEKVKASKYSILGATQEIAKIKPQMDVLLAQAASLPPKEKAAIEAIGKMYNEMIEQLQWTIKLKEENPEKIALVINAIINNYNQLVAQSNNYKNAAAHTMYGNSKPSPAPQSNSNNKSHHTPRPGGNK